MCNIPMMLPSSTTITPNVTWFGHFSPFSIKIFNVKCSILQNWSLFAEFILLCGRIDQRTITLFVRGSITVRLTFCLTDRLGCSCFVFVELVRNLLVWSNANRRSVVQWYFPLQSKWVFSGYSIRGLTSCLIKLLFISRIVMTQNWRLDKRLILSAFICCCCCYLLGLDDCLIRDQA